jgi:predicted O-methyltransferase YrrM
MKFQEALERRFKSSGRVDRDNLPSAAVHRANWGSPGDHGRQSLARMIGDMGYREGVEIGTHKAESSRMWLKNADGFHLTCIDPYATYAARQSQNLQDAVYAEAVKTLKPYNADIIRAASLDVVGSFGDSSIDFLYIDGDHEFDAVMQDLICWAPKVRAGGMIVLHDYCVVWRGGVMKAVDAYTSAHRIDPWYVTRDYNPCAFWEKGIERA